MPNRPTQNVDSRLAQRNPSGIQFTAFIRSETFLTIASRDRKRSFLSVEGLALPAPLWSWNVTRFFGTGMGLLVSADEDPPCPGSPLEDGSLSLLLRSSESSRLVLRSVRTACNRPTRREIPQRQIHQVQSRVELTETRRLSAAHAMCSIG